MRELPRDLPLILRTEAGNQREPPIDYAVAEDGLRMVVRPEPDVAMAELLEEAADALDTKDAEIARLREENAAFAAHVSLLRFALGAERQSVWANLIFSASAEEAVQAIQSRMRAAEARAERAEKALREIDRRTGLLIHQNTGRWDMRVEHDRRTADVLAGNREIAGEALDKETDNG